ncbi:hypothetical protein [Microbacterium sp.]|uniref:hypothetical protein n=1 Tax=Microbacterium sp. TaxID=51671 RepID=UPI003C7255BB
MLSSADDPVAQALHHAADAVLSQLAALPARTALTSASVAPGVIIDGGSGAGKSTLATLVAAGWPGEARVVALDDVYPGWDGLARGAELARVQILEPRRAGEASHWQRWDWGASRYTAADRVDPGILLIVEGSGVLTAASAALSDARVWLESPVESRRERALARDGEAYRPHWERWAAQEAEHLAADHPRDFATLVVEIP